MTWKALADGPWWLTSRSVYHARWLGAIYLLATALGWLSYAVSGGILRLIGSVLFTGMLLMSILSAIYLLHRTSNPGER